jgi:ABC-type phosphate transport system substrate-binding protein
LISGKGKADAWKSIDDAINYIEQHNAYNVDIEKIGLAYKKDEHVDEFISWILKNGENYNHEYGFLKLNDNEHNQ